MMLALFLYENSRRALFDKVGSAELEHTLNSVDLKFIQSFKVQKLEKGGWLLFDTMYVALFELQ